MKELEITIYQPPRYYTLYADGAYRSKTFREEDGSTLLTYEPGAAVFLRYHYPSCRVAHIVRNTADGAGDYPGLSKKVKTLLTARASRVDKLRRALSFLNENHGGALRFPDAFYLRLGFLIEERGSLDYIPLEVLVKKFGA